MTAYDWNNPSPRHTIIPGEDGQPITFTNPAERDSFMANLSSLYQGQVGGGADEIDPNAAIKKLAESLGLPPELFANLQSAGMSDIVSALIAQRLDPTGASSGGGGNSSSFTMGLDPQQEFAANAMGGRDQAIASLLGEIMATEYQRKGMQITGSQNMLDSYSGQIGSSAPKNLESIPGFEPGGLADKYNKMSGGPENNPTIEAFRHPERATVPFDEMAKLINSVPTPEEMMNQYKPIAEQLIREIPTPDIMQTSGSSSGSSGVSGGLADFLNSYMNPETPSPALIPKIGGIFGGGSSKPKTPKSTTGGSVEIVTSSRGSPYKAPAGKPSTGTGNSSGTAESLDKFLPGETYSLRDMIDSYWKNPNAVNKLKPESIAKIGKLMGNNSTFKKYWEQKRDEWNSKN